MFLKTDLQQSCFSVERNIHNYGQKNLNKYFLKNFLIRFLAARLLLNKNSYNLKFETSLHKKTGENCTPKCCFISNED